MTLGLRKMERRPGRRREDDDMTIDDGSNWSTAAGIQWSYGQHTTQPTRYVSDEQKKIFRCDCDSSDDDDENSSSAVFSSIFFPFSDSFSSVESFHKTAREDPWTVFPPLIDFYFYFDVCFFSFVLQHWLPLYSGCNGLDEIAVMLPFQWPRIKMLME